MNRGWFAALCAALMTVSFAAAASSVPASGAADSSVPQTRCGAGSQPETGLQGQVPRADRDSGRSQRGYWCNLFRIGQYQGDGATWVQPSYGHCSYLGTFSPGPQYQQHPGVHVVDVSDERHRAL